MSLKSIFTTGFRSMQGAIKFGSHWSMTPV